MKTFFLHIVTCFCCLIIEHTLKAQNILHLSGTVPLFVQAGTTLSLDSLVLLPSANFTLTGANDLVKSKTVIHPAVKDYIHRVYRFSNPLPAFTGAITIYYHDYDVDYLTENDLTLEVYNGSVWNRYNTGVSRDAAANFVTTAGLSNLTLSELTLTGSIAPLIAPEAKVLALPPATMKATEATPASIAVFPNPATSTINIVADKGAVLKSIKLYNEEGGLADMYTISNSYQYTINISRFASGIYTIVIVLADGRSITKKILKQ